MIAASAGEDHYPERARGDCGPAHPTSAGESSDRLLVIEGANLGAKGSHQLVVFGGGALDETEVLLRPR
jgi:hypothetical protein